MNIVCYFCYISYLTLHNSLSIDFFNLQQAVRKQKRGTGGIERQLLPDFLVMRVAFGPLHLFL